MTISIIIIIVILIFLILSVFFDSQSNPARLLKWGIGLGIVLIFILLWFFLDQKYIRYFGPSTSENIAFMQLIVEALGIVALLIAALEFLQSKEGPNLDLFLQPVKGSEPLSKLGKVSTYFYQSTSRTGEGFYRICFDFDLILKNSGNVPGKYLSIDIETHAEIDGKIQKDRDLKIWKVIDHSLGGTWEPLGPKRQANWIRFYGGDNYIAYSFPGPKKSWKGSFGRFRNELKVRDDDLNCLRVVTICTIQADKMEAKEVELHFFPEDDVKNVHIEA